MRKTTLALTTLLAVTLVPLLHATHAGAQNLRSWVSRSGSGDLCSFSQPCADFQAAITKTIPGGEIRCIDAGNYPPFTIEKAISIVCDDYPGAVTPGAAIAIVINIKAGPNDIVSLSGLDIDGVGGNAVAGIVFQSGATLHLNKIKVRNFRLTSGNAGGIYFQPNTNAQLYISDSIITGNSGSGPLSGGIVITPGSAATVNAFISRVKVENNSTGIFVDGTRSTGAVVNATVLDTMVVGNNSHGILAQSSDSAASVLVYIDHSVVSNNLGSGVRASGGTIGPAAIRPGIALAWINDSTIVLNSTGVSINGRGGLRSYKNNRVSGNETDGASLLVAVPLQ